jgi:hypothetical protein
MAEPGLKVNWVDSYYLSGLPRFKPHSTVWTKLRFDIITMSLIVLNCFSLVIFQITQHFLSV